MFNEIEVEILRALIEYDDMAGSLTWRKRPKSIESPGWNARYAGKKALNITDDKGYLHGRVLGKNIKAHRAAWAIYHGEWPENLIDHVNGSRCDNRIINLRSANLSENNRNRRSNKNSTSSYLGVHWNSRDSAWEAQINNGNKILRLGKFEFEVDAALAYDAACTNIHGNFANPNFK